MNKKAWQILVMGVSGSGKTSVGKALAKVLACDFIDADDYHLPEAKAMMAAGTPLTDKEREPWLFTLCELLSQYSQQNKSVVLAVSGLKRQYRIQLKAACTHNTSFLLNVSAEELRARIKQRNNHFFPSALLDSQILTLETPMPEEGIQLLDGHQSVKSLVNICKKQFM